ncbi:MAG: nucleotide pyrophosphohydrolase [bacterium]|nr:nucleotide pyrophosphohydrolase [bacterium]
MKLSELQTSIKSRDFSPENKNGYFLKLVEEVGELSEAIRKERDGQPSIENLKGSIAEELYDIIYYVCALANVHGVDLEAASDLKDNLNKIKYNR